MSEVSVSTVTLAGSACEAAATSAAWDETVDVIDCVKDAEDGREGPDLIMVTFAVKPKPATQ